LILDKNPQFWMDAILLIGEQIGSHSCWVVADSEDQFSYNPTS
jgi:hypothetical protein